jgi:hypothetical protein
VTRVRAATWAIGIVMALAASAVAAPWSLELPAGYTEQTGIAEEQLAALRKIPRTVSADAQVYVSADGKVRLTRLTWLSQFDVAPTRGGLESMERGVAAGAAKQATKHISDAHRFEGDVLAAEQVDEVNGERVVQRRLYAVDTSRVVHLFIVTCAGPADQLAACERAQASMQLTLPNQAKLTTGAPREEKDPAYIAGYITGIALVVVVVAWFVWRQRRKAS